MSVLIGLAAMAIVLLALQGFTKADPKGLVRGGRYASATGLFVIGALLLFRGEILIAALLVLGGLSVLGVVPWRTILGRRAEKRGGPVSRVRSAFLEMELDHDTGAMRGTITAGPRAGTPLEALGVPAVVGLLADVDEESRALLTAYLDRRDARWRQHTDDRASAGDVRRPTGKMTEEEAYQILGVAPGASADEIGRAHRTLMKKLHPDQGGSTYLASRVNEAKDVLIRRHR
jgi:hypothetical protein